MSCTFKSLHFPTFRVFFPFGMWFHLDLTQLFTSFYIQWISSVKPFPSALRLILFLSLFCFYSSLFMYTQILAHTTLYTTKSLYKISSADWHHIKDRNYISITLDWAPQCFSEVLYTTPLFSMFNIYQNILYPIDI